MSNLFNPSYLKQLCLKYNLTPSKKYGQNFLINPEPIEKMLEAAELKKDDVVIEVGPGFGELTLTLAEKTKKVLAFEIEKKLDLYWNEKIKNDKIKNLEIIWGNILRNQEPEIKSLKSYKVVANLPYQITSNVIRYFLEAENKPELMVLMVQKEVAERICAHPTLPSDKAFGGRAKPGKMSVLSVAVQYCAQPEIIMNVPRTYFWPEPAVDSAVIKINVRTGRDLSVHGTSTFFRIVKAGFANRRKLLIKNLMAIIQTQDLAFVQKIFSELSLLPTVRAQELSVKQWQALVRELSTLL